MLWHKKYLFWQFLQTILGPISSYSCESWLTLVYYSSIMGYYAHTQQLGQANCDSHLPCYPICYPMHTLVHDPVNTTVGQCLDILVYIVSTVNQVVWCLQALRPHCMTLKNSLNRLFLLAPLSEWWFVLWAIANSNTVLSTVVYRYYMPKFDLSHTLLLIQASNTHTST